MAPPFKILIAGAGLGGVTLAVLLECAKIDFEIFESSSSVSPLGTAHVFFSPYTNMCRLKRRVVPRY